LEDSATGFNDFIRERRYLKMYRVPQS
jgi:hypothetical protein